MLEKVSVFDPKYIDDYVCLKCIKKIEKYNLMKNDVIFARITTKDCEMIIYEKNNTFFLNKIADYDYMFKIIEIRRKE